MDETWRSFATAHHRKLKAKNPSATFKDALRSAAPLIRSRRTTYTRCEVRWQLCTGPSLTLSTKPKLTVWKLNNMAVC
jgi:hypothetical protein